MKLIVNSVISQILSLHLSTFVHSLFEYILPALTPLRTVHISHENRKIEGYQKTMWGTQHTHTRARAYILHNVLYTCLQLTLPSAVLLLRDFPFALISSFLSTGLHNALLFNFINNWQSKSTTLEEHYVLVGCFSSLLGCIFFFAFKCRNVTSKMKLHIKIKDE